MSEIKVIDNLLPKHIWKDIHKLLIDEPERNFWELRKGVSGPGYDLGDYFQFTHAVYEYNIPVSPLFDLVEMNIIPAIEDKAKIKFTSILKAKFNLLTKSKENDLHGFHTDFVDRETLPIKTAVYYVNTNNGKTKFETGEEIDSVANRIVIFPHHLRHSSVSQTDTNVRVVLNLNWF